MLVVVVFVGASAEGGKDVNKMLQCLVFNISL
jgi:hypothetical protein